MDSKLKESLSKLLTAQATQHNSSGDHDLRYAQLSDVDHFIHDIAICSTAGSTAAKVADYSPISSYGRLVATDGTLNGSTLVTVRFANTNTASNPTLNIAGSGAFPIYWNGSPIPSYFIAGGSVHTFSYNTTSNRWDLVGTPAYNIADSSSSSALGTSRSLVTERDVYYGTPRFNGDKLSNSSTLYAPTSVGTFGYVLISNGLGAPTWGSPSSLRLDIQDWYSVIDGVITFNYGGYLNFYVSPSGYQYIHTGSNQLDYLYGYGSVTGAGYNCTYIIARLTLIDEFGYSAVEHAMLWSSTRDWTCNANGLYTTKVYPIFNGGVYSSSDGNIIITFDPSTYYFTITVHATYLTLVKFELLKNASNNIFTGN